jgi:hypothetical protein
MSTTPTPLSDLIKRALLENEKYIESIEAKLSAAETALAAQTAENALCQEAFRDLHEAIPDQFKPLDLSLLDRVKLMRDTLTAENARLREDKERLEWLMEFITQNGASAIADQILWTVVEEEEGDAMIEDRADLAFDRAAIDKAIAAALGKEQGK